MNFIEELWTKHRTIAIVLGLILLPITVAIIGFRIYAALGLAGAKKSLDETQKKDDKLSAQEDELKKQADSSLVVADKAAQRRENRKEEDSVDLDWASKRKD